MKLFYKLVVGFLTVFLILSVSSIYLSANINDIHDQLGDISLNTYPINFHATNLESGADSLWLGTFIYANGDPDFGRQKINEGKNLMRISIENLADLNVDVSEITLKEESVLKSQREVINLVNTNPDDRESISFALNFLQQRISALDLEVSTLADESNVEMFASLDAVRIAELQGHFVVRVGYILIVVSFLISIIFALLFSKSITKPVTKLMASAKRISQGKLNTKARVHSTDEIGELAETFNDMRLGLKDRNDLLNSLLNSFKGKFGKIAAILMRKNIQELVRKNPRIIKIIPKDLARTIEKAGRKTRGD